MAGDDLDPWLTVYCPKCRAPLAFVASSPESGAYLYVCLEDGLFTLTENDPKPVPLSE